MSEKLIQAERNRLARMVQDMIHEMPWADNANSRMALAIAASNVRRGRPLTSEEKFANFCDAIAEDDPALAERLRARPAEGQALVAKAEGRT